MSRAKLDEQRVESGAPPARKSHKADLRVDFTKVRPRFTREEKERIYRENRALLEEDLWDERLTFKSKPFLVDLQLSNFCNMSCTMCYGGENPPLKVMPPELVEKVGRQILPTASLILPFAGSEPLILTWDLTRKLAIEYGIELYIITNLQFLDEKKFREVEPHVSLIYFSIDSHIPEIYEAIRLRSRPKKVFENLPRAAQLCKEHGIEVIVNVVFMIENAPWMDGTVEFMADQGIETVHILRYLPFGEDRRVSDPLEHMSKEWIGWMRERCVDVARRKKIKLIWDVEGSQVFDFRENPPAYRPTKIWDPWIWKLQHYLPRYCAQSVYRVKVDSDGAVYPCCVGDQGVLALGNLFDADFDEIWNGINSQDLRRGMMTWDVPKLCRTCTFYSEPIGPESYLPFLDDVQEDLGGTFADADMELVGPAHLYRAPEPPVLEWTRPHGEFTKQYVVMGLGGESLDRRRIEVPPHESSIGIPESVWNDMRANFGYWWTVVGVDSAGRLHRASSVRCVIRHRPMPRIEGSTLDYGD